MAGTEVNALQRHLVEERALSRVDGRGIVIAAQAHAGRHCAHTIDTFVGIGAVSDHVAETEIETGALLVRVRKHRIERLEISVHVGIDGEFHAPAPRYCFTARSTSPFTRRPASSEL